jgi:UDP:flavonoid glycosyltransferase YjiC (YdhE family)
MKIVYITNGMTSTLNSSFELSRRLRAAGHDVVYLSPADVVDQVEAQGLRCIRLTGDRVFQETIEAPVPPYRGLSWRRALKARRRLRRESIENYEIERAVAELEPDLLLIDIEMHFAIIATASTGLPTLLPIVWFSIFRRPGLPPMHTSLEPAHSWRQRLAIRWSWWRLRLETIHGEWRDRLRRALSGDVLRPVAYDTFDVDDLRALARSRGFAFNRLTNRRHWLRPYVYTELPVLCFNAWEMELPQESWPTVHYVGPMVHRQRADALLSAESAAQWAEFMARRGNAEDGRPLIYCSLGTFWSTDRAFLRRVLDVFARRLDWDLVLGLGGKLDPEALAPIPPNALVVDYAPQLEVLQAADCAITHGGITTINECIELGVPMVVYSTRHVDQNGCAVRVAVHGLGVVGDKDVDDGEALERNIERALTDREIRRNVGDLRERFSIYRETRAAIKVIEQAAAACQ